MRPSLFELMTRQAGRPLPNAYGGRKTSGLWRWSRPGRGCERLY